MCTRCPVRDGPGAAATSADGGAAAEASPRAATADAAAVAAEGGEDEPPVSGYDLWGQPLSLASHVAELLHDLAANTEPPDLPPTEDLERTLAPPSAEQPVASGWREWVVASLQVDGLTNGGVPPNDARARINALARLRQQTRAETEILAAWGQARSVYTDLLWAAALEPDEPHLYRGLTPHECVAVSRRLLDQHEREETWRTHQMARRATHTLRRRLAAARLTHARLLDDRPCFFQPIVLRRHMDTGREFYAGGAFECSAEGFTPAGAAFCHPPSAIPIDLLVEAVLEVAGDARVPNEQVVIVIPTVGGGMSHPTPDYARYEPHKRLRKVPEITLQVLPNLAVGAAEACTHSDEAPEMLARVQRPSGRTRGGAPLVACGARDDEAQPEYVLPPAAARIAHAAQVWLSHWAASDAHAETRGRRPEHPHLPLHLVWYRALPDEGDDSSGFLPLSAAQLTGWLNGEPTGPRPRTIPSHTAEQQRWRANDHLPPTPACDPTRQRGARIAEWVAASRAGLRQVAARQPAPTFTARHGALRPSMPWPLPVALPPASVIPTRFEPFRPPPALPTADAPPPWHALPLAPEVLGPDEAPRGSWATLAQRRRERAANPVDDYASSDDA